MNILKHLARSANQPTTHGMPQLAFTLTPHMNGEDWMAVIPGSLKLFVRAAELPAIFGSVKVARILARNHLKPTIRSPRLTLYWLGDVFLVADRLRRGEIQIELSKPLKPRQT